MCLTLGSHGAVVFNEEEAVTVRQTLEVKVVSTVGAGDASLGALVAALVEQRPLEEARKDIRASRRKRRSRPQAAAKEERRAASRLDDLVVAALCRGDPWWTTPVGSWTSFR